MSRTVRISPERLRELEMAEAERNQYRKRAEDAEAWVSHLGNNLTVRVGSFAWTRITPPTWVTTSVTYPPEKP